MDYYFDMEILTKYLNHAKEIVADVMVAEKYITIEQRDTFIKNYVFHASKPTFLGGIFEKFYKSKKDFKVDSAMSFVLSKIVGGIEIPE